MNRPNPLPSPPPEYREREAERVVVRSQRFPSVYREREIKA
jgi:hypothetical protein